MGKVLLFSLPSWCYVAVGAALGAVARHYLNLYVVAGWPGVAMVNILGCFVFGTVLALCLQRGYNAHLHPLALLGLVGFCGSFTTFSSYVYHLVSLYQQAEWGSMVLNLLGQHVLGIAMFALGMWFINIRG